MKKTQDKAVDLQQAQREYEAKLASLMQRYPKLFRKNLRAQYMYAIEDGWFGIIENLCARSTQCWMNARDDSSIGFKSRKKLAGCGCTQSAGFVCAMKPRSEFIPLSRRPRPKRRELASIAASLAAPGAQRPAGS